MGVYEAGRGGEITYHGPGQLIAYPIIALQNEERDLHRYLRNLEEVALGICRHYGIGGRRIKQRTGVWVDEKKIAAIGVRARSWVTYHGIAINRTPDLQGFELIVPCGISEGGVTSLEDQVGTQVSARELEDRFCEQFSSVFERTVQETEERHYDETTVHRTSGHSRDAH